MTTQVRRDILQLLAELSDCCPEVRFGQLVANLSYLAKGPTNQSIWDVEDEELLAAAREHLDERRNKEASSGANEALQPTADATRLNACVVRRTNEHLPECPFAVAVR